ncbi:TQO small subunit DoxD, partial [Rugosimonospora africana]|uniref:TQO small subunit DoxD n=1 Tax=Rugosimonospora africana TaxID=556532 RepID=UPI001942E533
MSTRRGSTAAKNPRPAPSAPVVPTSRWQRLSRDPRLGEAAWVLLPLRAFLGVTFLYAGLSKIFDPHYLNDSSPLGVHAQMLHAATGSPIGPLVTFSAQHATVTGLMIAFGEAAAGLGALVGLFTRAAAAAGVLLALSFFLTVSWRTTPYYFGSDIVFVFAWTPLLLAGDGDLLSVRTLVRRWVRGQLRLSAIPDPRESISTSLLTAEVNRRTAVTSGVIAGVIGAAGLVTGSALALGRRGSGPASAPASGTTPAGPVAQSSGTPTTGTATTAPTPAAGRTIAKASDVAVGNAKSFSTADGNPAWLLHPSQGTFKAYSAVCTHQG